MSEHDPKPLTGLVDLCESTGVEKAYVDVGSLRDLLDERDRYREALEGVKACGECRGCHYKATDALEDSDG